MNLKDHIRIVPGFPKPGINFYDISTLLANPAAFRAAIAAMKDKIAPYKPGRLLGIESRGFLLAAPLAHEMGIGFGMIRKKGKLPGQTLSHSYTLEYGQDTIEIQPDLLPAGSRVMLVDDLLATGGTITAARTLVENAGSTVLGCAVAIELEGLGGRAKFGLPVETILQAPA